MLYLTPTRYRSMGTGVDLSGKTDSELRSLLTASAAAINAAVGAPTGYSFLGGHVEREEHNWRPGDPYRGQKPQSRIWPYMRPVISADSLEINPTKEQFITFTEDELFVQTSLGYVEPVGAPNTTALYTSIPPWLLNPPVSYLTYDYGFHEVATEETPATISGGILQGDNQFWFTDEDVVLKKDGVVVDPSDYEVDYTEGWITPDTPPAGETYTISYHYHLPPGIAIASAWITNDIVGQSAIAAAGLLGLSGIKVEEVELRQSSKINFAVQPINAAAKIVLGPYAAMFVSMR